ncbi:nitroreductase family protein [Oricola nitratireducens]|uniref:nitroreductase family protein n=1 Tax=Oricola nitratireducens TaxID=2775868 RepID=UPI001865C064|nr:nitroreductase [Oricola nitratireducens]
MTISLADYLKSRRSVPLTMITGPGPDESQLREMLSIAARSPDHGRLEPWRFIIYREAAGREIGEKLAVRAQERNGPMPEDQIERERNRLCRAPVAVGVVSSAKESDKIPDWEQFLSAGAVAMNLLHAAAASGFAANWVTGWYSDDEKGRAILGLAPHERMAGIVHIGSCDREIADRPRPDIDTLISDYAGEYGG